MRTVFFSFYSKFTVSLVSALGIGVFFAYKDRRKKDEDTYYFGNKSMAPVSDHIYNSVFFTHI